MSALNQTTALGGKERLSRRMAGRAFHSLARRMHGRSPYWRYYRRRKVIYIHVPKTGGTSILSTLARHYTREHLTWRDYQRADARKFDDYFKFAAVRSPWDRLASFYRYMMAGGNQAEDWSWQRLLRRECPSFESFVMEFMAQPDVFLRYPLLRPQSAFIFDEDDRLMVDAVLRQERLAQDFDRWRPRIRPDRPLPRLNQGLPCDGRTDYCSLYSQGMRDAVARFYERDIRLLGYEFAGPLRSPENSALAGSRSDRLE